jgi:uncharacterized membrane protein
MLYFPGMESHQKADERLQFQIDRIAFFSDAVIAIAITLLILELKLPVLGKHTTWQEIMDRYGDRIIMTSLALVLCFMSIGNLWLKHHELYRFIHNYNRRLVLINLYFLLAVMFLPLTTITALEQDNPTHITLPLFFFNIAGCYLLYYGMLLVIFHEKNRFSSVTEKSQIHKMKLQPLMLALVFILGGSLAMAGYFKYLPLMAAVPVLSRLKMRLWDNRRPDKVRHKKA